MNFRSMYVFLQTSRKRVPAPTRERLISISHITLKRKWQQGSTKTIPFILLGINLWLFSVHVLSHHNLGKKNHVYSLHIKTTQVSFAYSKIKRPSEAYITGWVLRKRRPYTFCPLYSFKLCKLLKSIQIKCKKNMKK